MELTREQVEAFQKAWKRDTREELSYKEAYEPAVRLAGVFQILEKAAIISNEKQKSSTNSENKKPSM